MLKKAKSRLFKGLLSFIPLIIILAILNYAFSTLEKLVFIIFGYTNNSISITIGISIFILLFIYYIGYLIEKNRSIILFKLTENIIKKIPIIKSIYSIIKDMIDMFSNEKTEYKGVVYIKMGEGKILGFVTREDNSEITVFIPTTPNPTTGILLIARKENVEYVDIKIEDAFKKLISLGITK